MSKLVTDAKEYAKLLNSVGVQGTGPGHKRPLSPVQCADAIRRIQEEEGENLDKIAERLGLGRQQDMSNMYKKRDTTQLSMFLNLHKVSEKSRDLAGWGTDPWPKIPFSTVALLSTLDPEEQDVILQSAFNDDKKRVLGSKDVALIKKWRRENPDMPIRECIEGVLKLKPVTVVTYVVVMEIRGRVRDMIGSGEGWKKRLLGLLSERLPGRFHDASAGSSVVTISMDAEAYEPFRESQYGKGVSYTAFLDQLLEGQAR